MKKVPKSRRAKPRKRSTQPRRGYKVMVRSHQDIWPEMTAEERREIMDFKFFPQDRAIYRRQMTKWRKIWDRIYKRLGYSETLAVVSEDELARMLGSFVL